jgi:hypothetical protein
VAIWNWRSRARKATFVAQPLKSGQDRREAVRYPCSLRCFCRAIRLAPESPMVLARVHDLSIDGLRLLLAHPLERGTFLALSLQTPEGNSVRPLKGCVMHNAPDPNSERWIVGCTLAHPLSEAEMKSLLGGPLSPLH